MPPELFTPLKIVHILSAIVAVGANLTYAFWLRRAGRDRDRLVYTISGIKALDKRVANPAFFLLLITGVLMVLTGAFRFSQLWLSAALAIYIVVALVGMFVYGPVVRRQLAAAEADPTSPEYDAAERQANQLGIVTLGLVLVIVVLMVAKPGL